MVGLALAQADSPTGPPSVSNAISNASRAQMVNLLGMPFGRPEPGRGPPRFLNTTEVGDFVSFSPLISFIFATQSRISLIHLLSLSQRLFHTHPTRRMGSMCVRRGD